MKYENIEEARFVRRLNRFAAEVLINGEITAVHVPNTGRLRELLIEGAPAALADSGNPARKYRYDLVSVKSVKDEWVNIDSRACNSVFAEWIDGRHAPFENVSFVKPEYTYGQSRVDFYAESGTDKYLIEVKGCTLETGGTGFFPDAPTERGVKHLNELAAAARQGYKCFIAFVIAVPGVNEVKPNDAAQPEFGEALRSAVNAGVGILFCPCTVTPGTITIKEVIHFA